MKVCLFSFITYSTQSISQFYNKHVSPKLSKTQQCFAKNKRFILKAYTQRSNIFVIVNSINICSKTPFTACQLESQTSTLLKWYISFCAFEVGNLIFSSWHCHKNLLVIKSISPQILSRILNIHIVDGIALSTCLTRVAWLVIRLCL